MGFLAITTELNPIFVSMILLAAAIAFGSFFGWLGEFFKLPLITGYFLSGIILGLILLVSGNAEAYDYVKIVGNIALAFIVFEMGTRLHFRKVRHNISEVIVIVLFQAIFTILLVWGAMFLFGAPWEMALLLGVIAIATSPETIMVISRNYRSKGHLTDAIMSHIGVDDIAGVTIFAVAIAIAAAVNSHTAISPELMIFEPMLDIFGSFIVGGLIGAVLALFTHLSKRDSARSKQFYLAETVCAILLVTGITLQHYQIGHVHFALSPILAPLSMGIVFTNLMSKDLRKENDEAIDSFTPPFIMVFFALIGIQLVVSIINLTVSIWYVLGIAIAYVVLRVVGKQLGVFVGSKVKKTPKEIIKYLVWSLLPQATVSIGMAQIVLANEKLPATWRTIIFVVTLIAAAMYQVVGPKVAEKTLLACKEIEPGKLNFFYVPKEGSDNCCTPRIDDTDMFGEEK